MRHRPEFTVHPIFTTKPRTFPGQRWANILLRTVHLVAVAGLGAGFIQGVPDSQWVPFWYLALGSGVTLMLLYIWSSITWLVQAKGAVILLKLLLLALAGLLPAWRAELFITVIVLSSVIAHAPGSVRGFGWRPGSSGSGNRP
jgi:hypothetical protein